MKRLVIATLLGLGALVGPAAAQQASERPLTNASVVKLVKAGFSDKTVIAIVQNRKSVFNLAPEELIQLKRQGVSENVILAMLATQDGTFVVNEDEEWASDEQFFKDRKKASKNADGSAGGSGIFGLGEVLNRRSEKILEAAVMRTTKTSRALLAFASSARPRQPVALRRPNSTRRRR